jgi:hypothetical protein
LQEDGNGTPPREFPLDDEVKWMHENPILAFMEIPNNCDPDDGTVQLLTNHRRTCQHRIVTCTFNDRF